MFSILMFCLYNVILLISQLLGVDDIRQMISMRRRTISDSSINYFVLSDPPHGNNYPTLQYTYRL